MQNMDLRKFQEILKQYGYKKVRQNGSSHSVYEREVVLKDSISVVENGKTINGPMADRHIKHMQDFEDYICRNTRGIK